MPDQDIEDLHAAIAALEGQRRTLGDAVIDLAIAPLRARLAALQRPAGLRHRQVTVLFADVVGSTALAQGLDAEDTLAVLSATLHRMASLVQAHQGRVLQFTGDGVKATFGGDEAREDDAERAVRAGLAILDAAHEQAGRAQREHGIVGFAVRVGLHTGDVAMGAGIEADDTAIGAAVNIAARMEQSAAPGTLRISHDTWSLVRGLFEVEPQPPLPVKGVEAPMKTYLVRAALDRSTASVERGLQGLATPMVGREEELQRLLDAVERARQTGHLQPLTVVGEAGLGKSRLLREFAARLGNSRALVLRSQPDSALRLWGLLRTLLATQCGVADTDSAEVARGKVMAGLCPWFDERGERQAQLIGQLSGLDFGDSPHLRGLDPRALRDQAFAALRTYLRALALRGEGPLVLIAEDLHWADDGSLDVLQHLVSHAAELPLVLVMTGRPALLDRRPALGEPGKLLRLRPLAPISSDALAQALLHRVGDAPDALIALIAGRAEGNPYYMEELVRRLIDDGVIDASQSPWTVDPERLGTLRLPGTLVGLLQARLDALPAVERQAARQASIIGHVFWDDALRALDPAAPQALPALQREAIVRDHDDSDFDGTLERQFDHHLLHEVTYGTLLKAERKIGHGVAARWLRARTQGRGAEFLAMTGEHAERAGELALAIDCFEQAGQEAQRRFANATAITWLRRAVDLLGASDPSRRVAILMRLNDVADIVGDRALQAAALQEAEAILAQAPDDRRQAELCFARALLADRRGDHALSERLSWQALALAEACGAARWAAMSLGNLAWLHIARQDYAGAGLHIEHGLGWAGRIEQESIRAETEAKLLTLSGMLRMQQSRLHEARDALLAVLVRGEALNVPRLQLGALDNLALVANYLGHWDESADWGERMRAVAERTGSPHNVGMAQLRLAKAAEALGQPAEALQLHARNLGIFRAVDDRRLEAVTLHYMAELHLLQGDTQAAWQACAQAQDLHRALQEPVFAAEVGASQALCELRLGRGDVARAAVDALLVRLDAELAGRPAHDTLSLRWSCQQVLEALGDARAAPMLDRLAADVQARVAALTAASDRDRLIDARADLRAIVSAHGRQRGGS